MKHKLFTVKCCDRRRGLINGVLVCSKCDYSNADATVIPNENQAKDVPKGVRVWDVRNELK